MSADKAKSIICLHPGQGRAYALGRMRSVFKADGPETRDRYSISEWWLEPHTPCGDDSLAACPGVGCAR